MNLLAVVTPPYIFYGCSTRKNFWKEKFTLGEFTHVNIKIVFVLMLGNIERSRIVISKSPWTSRSSLSVWTR